MSETQEAAARGRLDFTRGSDWFDPLLHPYAKAQVFGAGGIGSWAALGLCKLGVPYVDVVDFDAYEPHNVPNQFAPLADFTDSLTKVDALRDMLHLLSVNELGTYEAMVTDGGLVPTNPEAQPEAPRITGPLVVSGFDNMEARHNLWKLVKTALPVERYIDGRLAGETIVLYSVNPHDADDVAGYERTLHTDDEGVEAPCTRQSIIDVGMAVGSLITRAARRHFAGEADEPVTLYDVANLTIYKSGWFE